MLVSIVALVCAGAVASSLGASASVQNPGPVTITAHDGTLTTALGNFAPLTGTLTGSVDAAGALLIPQASIAFPSFDVDITNPIATTVTVTPVANTDFSGNVNPDTGLVTLTGSLTTKVTLAAFGLDECPLGPMSVGLSTANAGGSAYAAGSATVVGQSLAENSWQCVVPGETGP